MFMYPNKEKTDRIFVSAHKHITNNIKVEPVRYDRNMSALMGIEPIRMTQISG